MARVRFGIDIGKTVVVNSASGYRRIGCAESAGNVTIYINILPLNQLTPRAGVGSGHHRAYTTWSTGSLPRASSIVGLQHCTYPVGESDIYLIGNTVHRSLHKYLAVRAN